MIVAAQQHASPAERLIRRADQADAERIAEIYAHYVTQTCVTFDEEPPSSDEWRERLAQLSGSGHPVLVAETECGTVCGYAYAAPWKPKHAYRPSVENSIYLDPSATGVGIGGRLLAALIAACRESGRSEIIAVISDRDAAASVALHERAGFRPAGRLENVGFKFGTWVGVRLFQLSLG